MRFPEYRSTQPYGWLKRLDREGVASYSVLMRLAAGETISNYHVAKRVSDACDGEVSVAELCEPHEPKVPLPPQAAEGASNG